MNLCKNSQPTPLILIAVACAAIFVPFRLFLNPSIPHDRIICGTPLLSDKLIIVLFGETLMLQTGISLNGIPLNNCLGVSTVGNKDSFLKQFNVGSLHY